MDIKIVDEVYKEDKGYYEYTLEVDQDTFKVLKSLYGEDVGSGLSLALAQSIEDGTLEKWMEELKKSK